MEPNKQRTAVLATATLLGLLLLLPAGVAQAQECPGGANDAFCSEAEANADTDTGDSGNSGATGDGGSGGGGGNSGSASAGDGVGGPGGSAGDGGTGGGNGGNGGGGGAAGGSGNYSGATIGATKPSIAGPQGRTIAQSTASPSALSSGAAFGGGGGPSTSTSQGASTGGAGGTFCAQCSITLGGSDMVNIVAWKLQEPSVPSTEATGSAKRDESGNYASGLFLAGLVALIVFVKAPLPSPVRISKRRPGSVRKTA